MISASSHSQQGEQRNDGDGFHVSFSFPFHRKHKPVSDVFSFCTGRNRANWTGRFRGDGFMGFFISSSSGEEGTNRTLMLMVVRGGNVRFAV